MSEKDGLPGKIVDIEMLRINRNIGKRCKCQNRKFTVDPDNRSVYCGECGALVDPFEAIYDVAISCERLKRETENLLEQRRQIANYKPHLIVFKNLESQYRSKKYLPCCPECGEAFFFEHISSWVSRELEEQRREKAKAQGKQKERAELEASAVAMMLAIEGVLAIIRESDGVAGWNLNGEIAPWSKFGYPEELDAAIDNQAGMELLAHFRQVETERDWLRERVKKAGSCTFSEERDVGVSSNAMVEYALGGPEPSSNQYPSDRWDLAACERCRDGAPEHLHMKMDEVLEKYRQALQQRR